MSAKAIKCPNCGKTLMFHVDGCGSTYSIKCKNKNCRETVLVYSAGQTAIMEEILPFSQWKSIVQYNPGVDVTKIS